MLFTAKESIEDSIIRLLSRGKVTPSELIELVNNDGKNVTIQAVYKALRYLIKASVVVKSGKKLEISQEWIDTLNSTFSTHTALPQLADGEAATYNYKSLVNLDAYWKHLMIALDVELKDDPIFLYSPYHIWYHISERMQSEADYFNSFQKNKHFGFFVIGNSTALDQAFKKKFQSDYLQIDAWSKTSLKESDYLTVVGDYIIYTILDKKLVMAINSYYNSPLSQTEASEKLNLVLSAPNKSKIKIERNAQKAKRLRKKLFKNFYLTKELKGKFDLF